jgi:feruloyl esterase
MTGWRILALGTALFATPAAAQDCAAVTRADIAHVTVLSAEAVPAGPFQPPASYGIAPPPVDLPAFCRVRAVAHPVPGSRIGMEVWLPLAGAWNERFRMYGNGGYSGAMPLAQLAVGLAGGTLVAATDTGHQGDDPDFVVGLPESLTDWAWRAVHETAIAAKALSAAFYGRTPRHSYFDGCSTGGHQALMSAQRFPEDFDGIVAGAPGNHRTRLNVGFLWQFVSNRRADGAPGPVLPPAKLPLATAEALRQCGSAAERAQGWLADPFTCRPDPALRQCQAGDGPDCFTADQVAVLRRMYQGATNPLTGAQLYPPWLPGSESIGAPGTPLPGWSLYWSDPRHPDRPARESFFRFWADGGPAWDWRRFDFDAAVARMDRLPGGTVDAIDPDLSRFRARGGRLIGYHGLMDPVVSPWGSRRYHDAVAATLPAGEIDSFYRLFFAPGMSHCAGGPGVTAVEPQTAIEAWVENGQAPATLPARMAGDPARRVMLRPWPAIGL